ncbi:MAG: DUF3365 domain-containing protein [Pseudomonadota bacterium]|nr:DUF3365 domain-containing protein [Pseudomonadota bacterium]
MRRLLLTLAVLAALPVQAEDTEALTAEARMQAKALGTQLMGVLKKSIEQDGPEAAIAVCNTQAPEIASALSKDGWHVARTSLKIRNPENQPDAWEKQTLKEFEARKQAGEDPKMLEATTVADGEFRYMKAIPTAGLCVTCHGVALSEPVTARLAELYPQDKARGFNVGDLRGAFTIRKTLQD